MGTAALLHVVQYDTYQAVSNGKLIHPIPFAEDEWVSRNNRDVEIDLSQIGQVPEGYYNVNGTLLRVVRSGIPSIQELGWKTVGLVPYRKAEPVYFAFLRPNDVPYFWRSIYGSNLLLPASEPAVITLSREADPLIYGEAFSQSTGICWRCGHPLSRTESIYRGVGPVCWRQLGGLTDE